MLEYLTQTNEANSMPGEIYRNSGMVHSKEKSEVPQTASDICKHIDNGGVDLRIYVSYCLK